MSAPNEVLGVAVRQLGCQPSSDWLQGFDAGFDAGVAGIEKLISIMQRQGRLLRELDAELDEASKRRRWLDDAAREINTILRRLLESQS